MRHITTTSKKLPAMAGPVDPYRQKKEAILGPIPQSVTK